MAEHQENLMELTSSIVAAYVQRNSVPAADLPAIIATTHAALANLGGGLQVAAPAEPLVPPVSIKKSITLEYLICLEDGKQFKTLKRHLASKYGLTPDQYRVKWSLPADYPMVAPAYAERRSAMAKSIGLGKQQGAIPSAASGRGR